MDYQTIRLQLTAECNRLEGISEHMLTFGVFNADVQVQLNLIDVRLRAIRRALRRLDDGTYGICEVCGNAIEAARLAAMNDCSRCISCEKGRTRRRQSFSASNN